MIEWIEVGDGILVKVSKSEVQIIKMHDDGTYGKIALKESELERIFSLFRKKQLTEPHT